jgi:hypothetical protein
MQKRFVALRGCVLFFDVGGKHYAIAAALPFYPEQRPIQVLHDAKDLYRFARQVNFSGARVPHNGL